MHDIYEPCLSCLFIYLPASPDCRPSTGTSAFIPDFHPALTSILAASTAGNSAHVLLTITRARTRQASSTAGLPSEAAAAAAANAHAQAAPGHCREPCAAGVASAVTVAAAHAQAAPESGKEPQALACAPPAGPVTLILSVHEDSCTVLLQVREEGAAAHTMPVAGHIPPQAGQHVTAAHPSSLAAPLQPAAGLGTVGCSRGAACRVPSSPLEQSATFEQELIVQLLFCTHDLVALGELQGQGSMGRCAGSWRGLDRVGCRWGL